MINLITHDIVTNLTEEEWFKEETQRIKDAESDGRCGVIYCGALGKRQGIVQVQAGAWLIGCIDVPIGQEETAIFMRGLVCEKHFDHQDMIFVKFSR